MNNLVGKIFADRKNNERKVVIREHKITESGIEVVTIEFLESCGKKVGTVEDKFLKSFKKSWKETGEVIKETVEEVEQIEEVEHKLVPMPGIEKLAELKEEYSTEKEENLTDEDYAKIGIEIAEQARYKTVVQQLETPIGEVVEKPAIKKNTTKENIFDYVISLLDVDYKLSNNGKKITLLRNDKSVATIYKRKNRIRLYCAKEVIENLGSLVYNIDKGEKLNQLSAYVEFNNIKSVISKIS